MVVHQYVKDFENLGLGMFVHFGLYSALAQGEWVKNMHQIPDEDYCPLAETFCPDENWATELVKVAKNSGCRYITLTTRHHDGYSLYDTRGLNDYDAPHYIGRDLVQEFVDACRAADIIPFFYHTTLDWSVPSFNEDFKAYLQYLRDSVEVLCTHYGKIGGLWFDGNWSRKEADWEEDALYGMIRSHQPEAIIVNNTGLSRRGEMGNIEIDSVTFERGKPFPINLEGSPKYIASEMCEVFGSHWGYAENDFLYKSPERIIKEVCDCRRYGANMLLNVGPMANGQISDIDKAFYAMLGRWMAFNGEAIRKPRPCDVEILPNEQGCSDQNFLLRDGNQYYLFCYDLPMGASGHVGVDQREALSVSFRLPEGEHVKEAVWLDNGAKVDTREEDGITTVQTVPYRYGTNLVVRIVKFTV